MTIPSSGASNDIAIATTPFPKANMRYLWLLVQQPSQKNRSKGSPSQWQKFWHTSMPVQGRNLWWRYLQHSLPHAVFRSTFWTKSAPSPACPVCDAPAEDGDPNVALCPLST
ncbi:hypothetical protein BGZ82_001742 [Podila clonocystis]|nr:hypothetical protein BGZ82_001742 [Podila clonocystis]